MPDIYLIWSKGSFQGFAHFLYIAILNIEWPEPYCKIKCFRLQFIWRQLSGPAARTSKAVVLMIDMKGNKIPLLQFIQVLGFLQILFCVTEGTEIKELFSCCQETCAFTVFGLADCCRCQFDFNEHFFQQKKPQAFKSVKLLMFAAL